CDSEIDIDDKRLYRLISNGSSASGILPADVFGGGVRSENLGFAGLDSKWRRNEMRRELTGRIQLPTGT
ncbi:hypothetical protein JOQ06_011942, partial [Pogonophryne albipinna]